MYENGRCDPSDKFIDNYSLKDKKWTRLTSFMEYQTQFNVCAFWDAIYFVGSFCCAWKISTNTEEWTKVSRIKHKKLNAGCTVFQGRVVIVGGQREVSRPAQKTVVAYDPLEENWSLMPDMVERRRDCRLVALRNKLFGKPTTTLYTSVDGRSGLGNLRGFRFRL